ncbi:mas-related G-protein coupled receptor member X2 [Sigmodon hispidus]
MGDELRETAPSTDFCSSLFKGPIQGLPRSRGHPQCTVIGSLKVDKTFLCGLLIDGVNGSNHTRNSFCNMILLIITSLSIIIGLIGMVGNAIVLWILGFRMHRNPFSVYILNLAGADFLFMCFQIVYCIHYILYILYSKIFDSHLLTLVALNFAYLCELSILSAISIERSLSVLWPIWYRCQRPRHTSAVICSLLWFLSLLLSVLEGEACGLIFRSFLPIRWCQTFDIMTVAWLIVLFVVLLGSSLALVVTIFCGSQRFPVTRLYVTIVCTVLIFLIFGLPYGISWFLLYWIQNFVSFMPCYFSPMTRLLSCINSCANPIIYFLVGCIRNRRFQRNTLKEVLQRALQDTPEEEEEEAFRKNKLCCSEQWRKDNYDSEIEIYFPCHGCWKKKTDDFSQKHHTDSSSPEEWRKALMWWMRANTSLPCSSNFTVIMLCTMILLSLIITLLGVVGNAIVLWLLGFHMHRNAFSVYILNLAGADFFFLCFQTVHCLNIIIDIFYSQSSTPIYPPLFFLVVLNFAYLCGLSMLSAVSIERSLSVMWPIWYRCQRPKHTSAVICSLLWVFSLLLSLLEGMECGLLSDSLGFSWCQTFDFITTAWLVVLFVVLLGSGLALVITIFCRSHRIPVPRLYVTIVCTVLVFLLFGLPYGIYKFLLEWIDDFNYAVPCDFYSVTVFLSCVNSCANPIIYFLVGSIRHRRFQWRALKLLLQRAIQDTPEEEECRIWKGFILQFISHWFCVSIKKSGSRFFQPRRMEERNTTGDFLSKNSSISTWETDITTNESVHVDDFYFSVMFKSMVFLCLIFALVGMAANAMVLWFLGFHMRRNAFSVYILNLAGADFLFLSFQFVICLRVILLIHSTYIDIPLFSFVVSTFAYISGLSILSAISIERCISVMWPLWYHCQRPRLTSAVTCALIWAFSLLLSLLHGNACGLLSNMVDLFWCQTFDFIMASWSIVLFVVLCGSSLTLLVKVFCGSQRIPVTRLYVTILLTVLFFLIFGLPLGIVCLVYQWIKDLNYAKILEFYLVTIFLSCVNSCVNPIIYFLIGSIRHCRFQQRTLKLLLQRALQDNPEEEEHGERGSLEEPVEQEAA